MIELKYDPWVSGIEGHYDDLEFIQAVLMESGYVMSLPDIYNAWMIPNDCIWEDPYQYNNHTIVNEMLAQSSMMLAHDPVSDDYVPKTHQHIEGEDYIDLSSSDDSQAPF